MANVVRNHAGGNFGWRRLYAATPWSPSDFVKDLGLAILTSNPQLAPSLNRFLILMMMVMGMTVGAWRYNKLKFTLPAPRDVVRHAASGVLMGVGASLGLGGNDYQLLLALPAQSFAGLLAIVGMLLGIHLGLTVNRRLAQRLTV